MTIGEQEVGAPAVWDAFGHISAIGIGWAVKFRREFRAASQPIPAPDGAANNVRVDPGRAILGDTAGETEQHNQLSRLGNGGLRSRLSAVANPSQRIGGTHLFIGIPTGRVILVALGRLAGAANAAGRCSPIRRTMENLPVLNIRLE